MDSPFENLIALFIRFERTSKILVLSANTVIGSFCGSKTMSMWGSESSHEANYDLFQYGCLESHSVFFRLN